MLLIRLLANLRVLIITHLPGDLGYALRYNYWKEKLKFLGNSVKIDTGVYFQNPFFIHIGDNCWIDKNVMILAGLDNSVREKITIKNKNYDGEPGVVHIGKNIHVGPGCIISGISAGVYISDECGFSANCKIYAFSHHYRSRKTPDNSTIHFGPMVTQDRQCIVEGPIFLGKNTGVALNAVLLPGVSIPENCFVAINSVVTLGRYSPNTILSGNPAKQTDLRFKQT
jgi:acetyltransferase-like isoleucine patch superfamily enzyme